MRQLLQPRQGWIGVCALITLMALVGTAATSCTAASKPRPQSTPPSHASTKNPLLDGAGGMRSVTFYYNGTTPLVVGHDLSRLGKPAVLVTTPKADDTEVLKAIHSTGAKAYRYLQFYWSPNDSRYEGINLRQHPDWAFCGSGTAPLLGRTTNGGAEKWYFIDANEKAVRAKFKEILAGFKASGWDGVFFDRGQAATQYAKDARGNPMWYRKSSCTGQPYDRQARFADAYVNMLGLAHKVGLQAMMNNGKSPFDPITPLRPDPSDHNCQAADWAKCAHLSDVWANLDLVLNEVPALPRDAKWESTFVGNQRSERSAAHGHRTVALITTATLGGVRNQRRANVFYEWSRVKLFNLAVAVNSGDGGCARSSSDACNRYGNYPDLGNVRFGRPLGEAPVSTSCIAGSSIHCVWTRTYTRGVNVLNASAQARRHVVVSLPGGGCHHVYDVYNRVALARDRCVTRVELHLPRWSGRPLLLSDQPRK